MKNQESTTFDEMSAPNHDGSFICKPTL